MRVQDIFETVNMMLLPNNERTLILDNEIMLSDMDGCGNDSNVTVPIKWQRDKLFKISYAITLLCERGTIRFRLNLTEYNLKKDDLLIAVPNSICEFIDLSPDCRLIMIILSRPDTFKDISNQTAIILRRYISKHPMISLSPKDSAEFRIIYESIRQKVEQADYNYKKEVTHAYFQVIYCNICNLMKPYIELEDECLKDRRKQIYDSFMLELQQHYDTRRDIAFYAERLCLTPKYLSQVILDVSGRYAKDWIRDYVILEAKSLLKSGQYTAQQVSDILKFPNQSFFGRYFKKAVGCSPKAYQENE